MWLDRTAYPFIVALGAAAAFAYLVGWPRSAWLLLVLGLGVAAFFRDPPRELVTDPAAIVSPADGTVVEISLHEEFPLSPDRPFTRVSIFLSIFNVHINRSPIAGTLTQYVYHPGRFMAAFNPKASLANEQAQLLILGNDGIQVGLKQIAGWVARRVVTRVRPGDLLRAGEKIGLIRFGSRVDVFVPAEARLQIDKGDRVKGGQSILARL